MRLGPLSLFLRALAKGPSEAQVAGITMDQAIDLAVQHVGPNDRLEVTKKGNFQFRSTETDANGDTVTRMGRLDVNPADFHVVRDGTHLNLETRVNGNPDSNLHIPIEPTTIQPGDIP